MFQSLSTVQHKRDTISAQYCRLATDKKTHTAAAAAECTTCPAREHGGNGTSPQPVFGQRRRRMKICCFQFLRAQVWEQEMRGNSG